MTSGYDDMGPKIDMGGEESLEPSAPPKGGPFSSQTAFSSSSRPKKSGGSGAVSWISLVLALVALGLGAWGMLATPEPMPMPATSPEVVPGATGERTAKLEKDVSDLMLRLVTLEKDLEALRAKAGSVNKLTEISAKVAALQSRLDNLDLENKMASMAQGKTGGQSQPAQPKPQVEAKPAPQPEAKPKAKPEPAPETRKKLTYVVKSGDSLFSIARRYKVTVNDLMKWNSMKRGDALFAGAKLTIYR